MNKDLQNEIKFIAKAYNIQVIFKNGKLTKESSEYFINWVNWYGICRYQELSERFIREFSDKVIWYYISRYQELSEEFIREFSDKVDWYWISYYQELSEGFIMEFYDKVNFKYLLKNKHIEPKIKEKLKLLQRTIQL